MRAPSLCLLFILVLCSLPIRVLAGAQDQIDLEFESCLNKDSTTSSQVECSYKYFEAWDKELNNSYKLLLRQLGEKEKKAAIDSQRAWLFFRDKEFSAIDAMYYENLHGTMYYPMRITDRAEVIKARVIQLRSRVSTLVSGK